LSGPEGGKVRLLATFTAFDMQPRLMTGERLAAQAMGTFRYVDPA
jgi:hypothetical protein